MTKIKRVSSRPAGDQPRNPSADTDEPVVTIIDYTRLIAFHLDRRRLDEDGNERPEGSLRNEQSIINRWLAYHNFCPSDPVGEELGIRFDECLANYLTALSSKRTTKKTVSADNSAPSHKGLAKQTIDDRKTVINKLRESFLELRRTDGLPADFGKALKHLMSLAGIYGRELARRTNVPKRTIDNWVSDLTVPSRNSIENIRKLERFFKAPLGTLSAKLR